MAFCAPNLYWQLFPLSLELFTLKIIIKDLSTVWGKSKAKISSTSPTLLFRARFNYWQSSRGSLKSVVMHLEIAGLKQGFNPICNFATQINARLASAVASASSELRSGDEAEDEADDEYVVTHVNEEVAARYYEFLLKEDDEEDRGPPSSQEATDEGNENETPHSVLFACLITIPYSNNLRCIWCIR